jgi:hypothetical protein
MHSTGKPKLPGWPARRYLALAAAVALSPLTVLGQTKEEASRLYFKADILARQAEQYQESGRSAQARQAFENALSQFQNLSQNYPEYSPAAVDRRVKDTQKRLKDLGASPAPAQSSGPRAVTLRGKVSAKASDLAAKGDDEPVAQQLASPAAGAGSARAGGSPMLASAGSPAGMEQDPMALLRAATPRATRNPAASPAREDRETGPSFQATPPERKSSQVAAPAPAPQAQPAPQAPKARGTNVGAESVAIEAQVQQGRKEIDALTRQLEEAERRLASESSRGSGLETEINSLRNQLEQSRQTIEEGQDQARKLTALEDKLKQMELVARKQTEIKDQELVKKNEELDRAKQDLAAAAKREEEAMEAKLREKLTTLAEERVELMQKNDQLSGQLRDVNAELAKFKDAGKADLSTVQLRDLQARIEKQTEEQKTTLEKVQELQNELKTAHDEAQGLREKLAGADAEKAKGAAKDSGELAEYKRRSEQAAKQKLESLQEIGRLRAELGTLNESLTKAQKERDTAVAGSANDAELAADLAKTRNGLSEVEKQRDHLAQRVAELQNAEKTQQDQAAELQNALAEARVREESAQADLKKSIADAKTAQDPLQVKVASLEKSQVETLDALNKERQQVAKLETEMDLLKKENLGLKTTVDKHKGTPETDQRIAELTQTLETVRKESAPNCWPPRTRN